MSQTERGLAQDLGQVARGFFMGGADIVPGVSGGTVALVLGIYERLVTAISHFDLELLGHLRKGDLVSAAKHVDLRFLLALGIGIGCGFLSMSIVMNRLLTNDVSRSLTLATFFGLIVGSAIIVGMMIRPEDGRKLVVCVVLGIAAAGGAFWLTTLTSVAHEPSYAYVFLCGCIAICAMILPGISGAMILLLMGIYIHLTEIPRNLLHGEHVAQGITTSIVFVAGAAISLVLFSKLLRWLLQHHHELTMSVLCGFMVGALPKLWPFQADLTPEMHEFKHKQFEMVLPDAVDGRVCLVLGIILCAAAMVVVVERWSQRRHASGEGSTSQ